MKSLTIPLSLLKRLKHFYKLVFAEVPTVPIIIVEALTPKHLTFRTAEIFTDDLLDQSSSAFQDRSKLIKDNVRNPTDKENCGNIKESNVEQGLKVYLP